MKKLALLLGIYITLSGCQLIDTTDKTVKLPQEETANADSIRPFTKDSLYALLLAEIAEQRGNKQLAQENYLTQATQTKDPQVIARAYQIAESTTNRPEQYNMAQLWISIAPNDPQANRAAALTFAIAGQVEAIQHLKKLLTPETQLDFLSIETTPLSYTERINLLSILDQLTNDYPTNSPLTYTRATLLANTKQNDKAFTLLTTLPPVHAHVDDVILLKAQVLDAMNKKEAANTLLTNEIANKSDNRKLRLHLAHRLIAQGKIKEAKQQYLFINKQDPTDYEILFGLSILCIEAKEYDEAINYLQALLDQDIQSSTIYFYLAFAYDQQGDKNQALNYYSQVNDGDNYLTAITNRATILFDQDKIDEAQQLLASTRLSNPSLTTLMYLFETNALQKRNKISQAWQAINKALKLSPKDTNLLYTRALLAAQTNRVAQAEKDLRHIIKIEPNNDTALNALGYVLTTHTTRYKEALTLIKRAFELNPDNPATLDSLGWVYYKLGHLDEAVSFLSAAYQAEPDPEIALHLGEALWSKGDQERAKAIWQEALQTDPQNTELQQTIKRFTQQKEL